MTEGHERVADKATVLVVEPSPLVRHGIVYRLLEHRIVGQLKTTDSAATGRRLAGRLRPDIVILSARQPDAPVAATVRALRRASPESSVVVTSGSHDSESLLPVLEAGAHGYLTRQASLDDVGRAVEAVYRGECVLPPTLLRSVIDRIARLDGKRTRALQLLSRLTRRERDILALVAQGQDNAAIAAGLGISPLTVRTHVHRILAKLDVHSRVEALAFVVRHQLGDELTDG